MKNIKQFIVGGLTLLGATLSLMAQVGNTVTVALTGTNQIFLGSYYVSQINVAQGAGSANATVNFYDSGNTNTFYTNAPWVSFVTVATNITSVLTNNSTGAVETNIYPGQWTYATTNAANTNTLPVISSFVTVPNSTSVRNTRIVSVNGLVATCGTATNVSVTVFYSPKF